MQPQDCQSGWGYERKDTVSQPWYSLQTPAENAEPIMQRLLARARKPTPQRTHLDYLGELPRRIYRFQPHETWITGTRLPIGNQLVDTKIQIALDDLIVAEIRFHAIDR